MEVCFPQSWGDCVNCMLFIIPKWLSPSSAPLLHGGFFGTPGWTSQIPSTLQCSIWFACKPWRMGFLSVWSICMGSSLLGVYLPVLGEGRTETPAVLVRCVPGNCCCTSRPEPLSCRQPLLWLLLQPSQLCLKKITWSTRRLVDLCTMQRFQESVFLKARICKQRKA